MQNKIVSVVLSIFILFSTIASAADTAKDPKSEENFAQTKAETLKNLNILKENDEKLISCVTATKNESDMQKCRDLQKANADAIQELKRSQLKARLQNELKKLDDEGKETKK